MMLVVSLVLAAVAPSDTLAKVQATYKNGGDVTAKFEQTYVDKMRGAKKIESGELWAKKDGKVRWSYRTPSRKDFVFDGKQAYFYEPENSQVTVFDKFQDSPVASAMRFLWGQGDLVKSFEPKACDGKCIAAGDAVSIVLTPKEPIAAVDRIQLDTDGGSGKVRRSIVVDPLGNRTEYVFKDLDLGAKVADAKFAFTIPAGVSVLHANVDSKPEKK
ncbi:MAG: outer membrane lipoprotein carrier protein LolA [Myxococcota bacterium]